MPMNSEETSLYQLVLTAVHSRKFDEQDTSKLVEYVRSQYVQIMKTKGMVLPESSVDGVEMEIRDSLKTITYGFYSIKEYNDQRLGAF